MREKETEKWQVWLKTCNSYQLYPNFVDSVADDLISEFKAEAWIENLCRIYGYE